MSMQQYYQQEVRQQLQKELSIANSMAVPRLEKIVVSLGVVHALVDRKNLERASEVVAHITGQRPRITRARKAIASFKLTEGDAIGLMVTLRGKRMYDFFEKLIRVVLPRLRDFHGVPSTSFDGKGNYTLGFSESTIFPEVDPGKVDPTMAGQGLEVTLVTTARDSRNGYALLKALGMPFKKVES